MPTTSIESSIEELPHSDAPFAIVRKEGDDFVTLLEGEMIEHDPNERMKIEDIPQIQGATGQEHIDTVSMVPFAQVRERGFHAHEGKNEHLRCMRITKQTRISLQDILQLLPQEKIELEEDPVPNITDAEYAQRIRDVQEREIGNGEVSNVVVSRTLEAKIKNMSRTKALSIYRALLQREYGSYMQYIFSDGDKTFIAASPERHLSVKKGEVTMNPISGTLRKKSEPLTKEKLLAFLRDPKEVFELFKVLDEEMKQMAQMSEKGGEIQGPFLKEMSKVLHTEFLLVGRTQQEPLDIFKYSMHAPTVVGGPLRNACERLMKYENMSRRYYAGAFLLTGRDEYGDTMFDSAINIRMMEIAKDGKIRLQAGATIVRDSDPEEEVRESNGKLAGLLNAILQPPDALASQAQLPALLEDPDVQSALRERMQHVSSYLCRNQENVDHTVEELKGKRITIIDNGDDFSHVMRHMIQAMGAKVTVVPVQSYNVFAETDLVIVGPGPGNPNNMDDHQMRRLAAIMIDLEHSQRPFIGLCLGHQFLCKLLGMTVEKKDDPAQGIQKEIDYFGQPQKAGFYNTFTAKHKDIPGVEAAYDKETKEVYALRGRNFASFQFHPESVLSKDGFAILKRTLCDLLSTQTKARQ